MNILICIREMPYAEGTVRFGGLIARLLNSPVTLMTVKSSQPGEDGANLRLEQAGALLEGLTVNSIVCQGTPLNEILRLTRSGDYELVVVGVRDMARLVEGLLGTFARKVANKADVSALVVREERPHLKRILLCVGGRKLRKSAVRFGARLAKAAGADVKVLHVTNPIPTMYTGLAAMEERLEELLQTDTPVAKHLRWAGQYLAGEGVTAELEVRQGTAVDEILREAYLGDYDLLVIGARSVKGPIQGMLVDQVTPQIVDRAPCPVLVARKGPEEAE